MQAIILAAGMGRRLNEYTRDNTKCMVEVNGTRLIDRVVRQLEPLGLRRLIIVVGYKGENLMQHLRSTYEGPLSIEFVENPIYDRTNNIYSLSLVKEQMQEDDTLLLESDLIFDDIMLQQIVANPYPNLCLVEKYEPWMDGTMVCIDEECNVTDFVSKRAFKYTDIDRYYKTINIYKFSQEFSANTYVPFLDAYCRALGNNEYYEQVLRVITLLDHANLRALPVKGPRWYEIDDAQDLHIAETMFAQPRQRLAKLLEQEGGYWRYPKMLDFSKPLQHFFPTERMLDEMRSNFDVLVQSMPSDPRSLDALAARIFGIDSRYVTVGPSAEQLLRIDDLWDNGLQLATWDSFFPAIQRTTDAEQQADNADPRTCMARLTNELVESSNRAYVCDLGDMCGLPGLQVGVVITSDLKLTERIRTNPIVQSRLNSTTEFFLQIFGKYAKRMERAYDEMLAERAWLQQQIAALPHIAEAEALMAGVDFSIAELDEPNDFVATLLQRHDILLAFDGNLLSANVRKHADNVRLVEALQETLAHVFS